MYKLILIVALFLSATSGCIVDRTWTKIDSGKIVTIVPRGGDSTLVYVYANGEKTRYQAIYRSYDCFFAVGDEVDIHQALPEGNTYSFTRR